MKRLLAIVLTLSMVFSVPVFADTTTPAQPAATETTTAAPTTPEVSPASDTTAPATTTDATPVTAPATTETAVVVPIDATTTEAGVTPDSLFYSLDKLMEKIQLSLVTDAVKQAELLAKIAQERLAESTEMANKADVELSQKALEEYKANLEKAVTLINTAMEQGKQVADVMENINDANLKDAAVVEQILASIPEKYKEQVKTEITKIAAAADATAETAATVEKKDEEKNSVRLEITLKLIEEKVQDPALLAKIKAADLNTRQIIAVISLSEQSKKPLGEVLDMFVANEKGIGATAHELGLSTKDALKGINESFKEAKEIIKEALKAAMKSVDEEEQDEDKDDQDEVEAIINDSLTGTDAAQAAEINAANEKLQKVIDEAKAQVAAISSASKGKKAEKAIEKSEKKIEKSKEQAEKALEKNKEKLEKAKKHGEKIEKDKHDKDNDKDRNDEDNDDNDHDEDED